jgi:Icc-related predicted phosphoesterase
MKKDKQIAKLKIEKQCYSIRATAHAILRMEQRKIDEYVVSGTIIALGNKKLLEYQGNGRDIAVIDKIKEVAVIATFKKNTIKIITVIGKKDIYVKDGTTIENISFREDFRNER